MIKRFLQWIGIKESIHKKNSSPLFFKESDIWWCSIGENIGIEINGKGNTFTRPVFVYKKISRDGFMGIPLSTKKKEGSWYIEITFKNKKVYANIAQARVFSSARMVEKMGELDRLDVEKIKSRFSCFYF